MTLVCSDEISALQIQGFTPNDPVKEGYFHVQSIISTNTVQHLKNGAC